MLHNITALSATSLKKSAINYDLMETLLRAGGSNRPLQLIYFIYVFPHIRLLKAD